MGETTDIVLSLTQALVQSGAAAAGAVPGSSDSAEKSAGAATGRGGAAADSLDGSRFWAEVSGIDDIDEEDDEDEDEDGEDAGPEGAGDDDDDDQPQVGRAAEAGADMKSAALRNGLLM